MGRAGQQAQNTAGVMCGVSHSIGATVVDKNHHIVHEELEEIQRFQTQEKDMGMKSQSPRLVITRYIHALNYQMLSPKYTQSPCVRKNMSMIMCRFFLHGCPASPASVSITSLVRSRVSVHTPAASSAYLSVFVPPPPTPTVLILTVL